MDCQLIQIDLVAFHFGDLAEPARESVERHLLECRDCLAGYLSIKREIETSQSSPRPSEAARLRLRRAVAEQVGAAGIARAELGWWRRPLGFGFAAATAIALAISVVSVQAQLSQLSRLAAPGPTEQQRTP